ncbi:hypothetical protein BpHYR1_005596 [Brachionus plicatilis]|uniref:Uncharacterized protein n=1 Tax=Brachionus plicatilis TaxID=10195 RepID=A0A3M7PJ00_BRAPC|nr:hypothetical protein BpHYR1_005596 [Brachionus plicatilis]
MSHLSSQWDIARKNTTVYRSTLASEEAQHTNKYSICVYLNSTNNFKFLYSCSVINYSKIFIFKN